MQNSRTIFICQGTGCLSAGSDAVYQALTAEIESRQVSGVKVDLTGCHGFCEQGPNVVVEPEGIFYTHVQAEDSTEIVSSHLLQGVPVERLFYRDPATGRPIKYYSEINFYSKQQRVILGNCGHINPEKIEQYISLI